MLAQKKIQNQQEKINKLTKDTIAIIPAKKNSRRLPGKNIKKINGKPLIWYSIKEALKSRYISEVVVSTDCKKIKNLAIKYGASVPFLRPKSLCKDNTNMINVVKHFYFNYVSKLEYVDKIILLQPTSPLRNYKDINSSIKFFNKKKADLVTSFSEAKPINWYYRFDRNKKFIYDKIFLQKPKVKKNYLLNGSIYIYKKELFTKKKIKISKSFGFVMSNNKSIDIDRQYEFDIANFLISKRLIEF